MAKVCEKNVTDTGVEFGFTNGENLVLNLSDLSPEMVTQLALHGISQKVGDAYSGVKGNVEEAISLARAIIDRLKTGEFNAKREGGSASGRVTDLARALSEVAGKEISECVAKLDEMEKAEKLALRKHPKVAAVLARLAAERAAEAAVEAEGVEEALDF